jgi:pimeloyl-ACP methyl ester carboxylesterase
MRRSFNAAMENSERTWIANGDVQLCVERRGDGPRNILFAHGWISARRMWYDVTARLDPERYTMRMFDFRGCGLSDRPTTGHDLEGYASDLRAVLATAGERVTLVAHSMGAKLAQLVASERPSNLERLILVAPGAAKATRLPEKHRALTLVAYGSRTRIERFQRAAMAREVEPASMERIVEDALVAQHEHWIGWYDRGRVIDVSDRLPSIAVPALVIAGASDPLAPPSGVKRYVAEAIDGALFVVLRGVGHNIPIEAPAEIAAAIDRFS